MMESESNRELEAELAKLTILKLRDLAHKNNVDISGTIRKKDIIDKLLEAKIPLDSMNQLSAPKRASEEKPQETSEGKPAAQPEIVEKWPETGEIDEKKIAEVREYIKSVMGNKPSFFTIDGELEAAVAKYDTGDYYGAILDIQKARQKATDTYAHFRIFTNAVGIVASEKVLDEAIARGSTTAEKKKDLIETAMASLMEGSASRREEALDRLERGAVAAFEKIIGDIGSDIQLLQKKASDLQELGGNVVSAMEAIGEADKLRLSLQIDKAKQLLANANDLLKQAEKVRVEELKYSIPRVRSMIDDAKAIGLDVAQAEKDLDKASYYLERGELKPCVEELSKANTSADQSINQKLASDPELRDSLVGKANVLVQEIAPSLAEAHSFGIDASEAYHYVSNAQIAIKRQDPINAMKFARRAEELSKQYGDDVKILKEKSVHVNNVRCNKCGQDMLYDYINGMRRCANCGTSTKR